MNLHTAISFVNSKFEYTPDPKYIFDVWKIMSSNDHGKMKGDCEDYALTVIWYACDQNLFNFLFSTIILGVYKVHRVTDHNGVKHVVGSYGDFYFDNWTKKALYKTDFFKSTRHEFEKTYFLPLMVFSFLTGFLHRR